MYTLLKNIEKKKANYVDNLLLSISCMVFTVNQGPQKKQRKKSVNLHLELINKVDKLIKEHNNDSFFIKSNLNQEMQVSDNNHPIEKRPNLNRKINLSEVKAKQHNDSIPVGAIIEEIDPEISFVNNHGSKFVSSSEITNNFQPMNGSLNARTEIIDLSSFSNENINSRDNNSFINDEKKIDVINTKEFLEKKSGGDTKMTLKSPEKINDKGQANYMKNSGLKDENKTKESGYKDSNNTSDFENTLKALDEKEKELKRKKQELLKKEKEAKKLRKLEAKKMKLEEREKAKAALKAKKEMEIIKKRQEKELFKKEQEEERLRKLELQVLAAEKIKREKEALSAEQQRIEEQQKLEKIEAEKTITPLKEEEYEKKHEATLLDDDVRKLLVITNNLLGELPDEVIDKFVESEDFELYSKVLQKYKIK